MTLIDARPLLLSAVLVLLAGGTAFSGSNNTIYVLQERSPGGAGNTLEVDQSSASNSLVRGLNEGEPAQQLGGGNTATLTIEGNGGVVELLQDTGSASGSGNIATIGTSSNALGIVSQIGTANLATLEVSGTLASGSIFQNGIGNNAGLVVAGTEANGSITQNGNNNVTNLAVTGAGTSVDYTVNGNNLTNVPGGGVQVYTNGATVTITQTSSLP